MSASLPICRVCLKTSMEYIDFDTPFEVDTSKQSDGGDSELTYFDCFLACTRLKINPNDENPQCLCSSCGFELKVAYEFLQKAEHADLKLRSLAANLKDEKPDEETLQKLDNESNDRLEVFHVYPEEQENTQLEDEKSYVCTICGDQFFSQFVLNLHVNRTHNELPEENNPAVEKFECQICDMIISLDKLNSHMQMHEEESNSIVFEEVNNEEQLLDVGAEVDYVMLDVSNHSSMDEEVLDTNDLQEEELIEKKDDSDDDNDEVPHSVTTFEAKTLSKDTEFYVLDKLLTEEEKTGTKINYETCTVCNKQIRSTSFQSHMNVHNGIRDFTCDYCPQSFFSKRALQKHTQSTHANKIKSVCKICHETVEGPNMKAHISEQHLQIVKCSQCDYECQEVKLKEHMKRKHSESKDFLCNVCSKAFTTIGVLNAHLKYHERKESNIKSDACGICGKVFSSNHYLKSHMLTHEEKRELYQCSNCDRTYHSKAALDNHMRIHKGNTIKCIECSKQFARQYELNVHMRFHTKNYPFECELCGKKFAIKGHLRTHMWRHQGLKLQCEECGKLFTSTKALQEHSFCHSEMPFPCPFCPKAYPSKPKFKVHLKTAHMVELTNDELQKMSKFPLPKRSRSKKFTLVQADSVVKEVEVMTKENDEEEIFPF